MKITRQSGDTRASARKGAPPCGASRAEWRGTHARAIVPGIADAVHVTADRLPRTRWRRPPHRARIHG
jgi:hypothetical protein